MRNAFTWIGRLKRKRMIILVLIVMFELFLQYQGVVTILSLFLFLIATSFLFYNIFQTLYRETPTNQRNKILSAFAVLCSVLLVFFIVELGLRLGGVNSFRGGALAYELRSSDTFPSWYFTHPSHYAYKETWREEFDYEIHTNSLGLRDAEWKRNKSKYRIITLGDSFTEGVGAPQDSTWPNLLQHLRDSSSIEVLNAGVQGSDPFFSFKLLKDKLLNYKPDMVMLMVNMTDIQNIMIRGGNERFRVVGQDSLSVNREDPDWIRLYAMSFCVRYLVHNILEYDYYLKSQDELPIEEDIAKKKMAEILYEFERLSINQGFKFVLITQPVESELITGCSTDMSEILGVSDRLKHTEIINLCDEITAFNNEIGPISVEESAGKVYWSIDGHFRPEGNLLVAEILFRKLGFNRNNLAGNAPRLSVKKI